MSFVFSSLGCRIAAACFSALMLSGCSGSDRIPFADIGGPRAGDQLIGKVDRKRDERVLVGRVGDRQAEAAAYAAPAGAQNAGSAGLDYLDTPNLAENEGPPAAPMMAAAEPGPVGAGQSQAMSAMVIPEGGVNIDGQLGIGEAPLVSDLNSAEVVSPVGVQPHVVTQGGAMAIAEGTTSQPVVDGIGFDEPTQIVTGPGGDVPLVDEVQVAEDLPDEGGILPLSADSGNSGMDDPVPVSTRRVAASKGGGAPAGKDCSLYLDKRNCR
ncbi:MAG: hypothetical protein ACK4UW_20885 [Rhizobium rhizophilum]|uniref:hypothetical protein n=1 Tax=Rhizobium rhizophilum TaxID=1850373 RepID=UPI00391B688A